MQNSMVMFPFSAFDQKYRFWANLVQKFKTVSLSWSFVPKIIRITESNGDVRIFSFWLEIAFVGKFGPKIKNCQFKLKFNT